MNFCLRSEFHFPSDLREPGNVKRGKLRNEVRGLFWGKELGGCLAPEPQMVVIEMIISVTMIIIVVSIGEVTV